MEVNEIKFETKFTYHISNSNIEKSKTFGIIVIAIDTIATKVILVFNQIISDALNRGCEYTGHLLAPA